MRRRMLLMLVMLVMRRRIEGDDDHCTGRKQCSTLATWKFVVNALFFTLSIFLKNIMLLLKIKNTARGLS